MIKTFWCEAQTLTDDRSGVFIFFPENFSIDSKTRAFIETSSFERAEYLTNILSQIFKTVNQWLENLINPQGNDDLDVNTRLKHAEAVLAHAGNGGRIMYNHVDGCWETVPTLPSQLPENDPLTMTFEHKACKPEYTGDET